MNRQALLRTLQPIAQSHGWQADLYRTLSLHASNHAYINTPTTGTPNAVILWRESGRPSILHLAWLWEVEMWDEGMIAHQIRSAVAHIEEAA